MKLEPYPARKESGVQWLGEVPSEWSVVPIRRRVFLRTDKAAADSRKVALENIESWTGRFLEVEDADYSGEGIRFSTGNVLFGKLRPYLAKSWRAEFDGAAVGDFHVYALDASTDPRFFKYVTLNVDFISLVDGSTYGSKMPRASWSFIGNLIEAFPPIVEQQLIADYLDAQTAKIDLLIEKQERLIETLAERRQAVITHAVTKGVRPGVIMKDSGVDWIGTVPNPWSVVPMKWFATLTTGLTPATDEPANYSNDELGFPWIRPEDLLESGAASKASKFVSARGWNTARVVPSGSTLVCCIGATVGKAGFVTEPCNTNQQLTALTPTCHDRYFFYSVLASKAELIASAVGNTLPILNTERLGRIALPVPPLGEQRTIAEHLDLETRRMDALAVKAREMIDVLKERRQALISAAVTGKIDVRGLS